MNNTDQQLHGYIQRLSFQNIPAIFEPITPAQLSAHISSSGKPIHYLRGLSFWMYSTGETTDTAAIQGHMKNTKHL